MDVEMDHPSRSPSPAQPPPTPAAPGPRASALQKLYADAIHHIIKTCSYTNFASCFPTPAKQVPGSVKLLHEQFTEKLGDSMRKEFDSILEERSVVASLNELDRLIEDAKRRKAVANEGDRPVPAHTLPAKRLYISHLAPTLKMYGEQMRGREEVLGEENRVLCGRVLQQRRDILSLMEGWEGVVRDLNGSVEALKPEEMDALREENREVDEGMR
jgi:kinetochore protein NNF1